MGLLDDIRNTLSKIRVAATGSVNAPANTLPVIPGLGQIEVVDTTKNPTNQNIPGSWSRSWLGPGQPFNIGDSSARDKDRETEPRSFQYVTQVNSTISPRIAYGLTPFVDLRAYAETVPEVAMCMRILTEELKAFVPTIVDDSDAKVEDSSLNWMIERPDGFNPWPVWLSRFLYNVLVYDAGCTYLMRNSRKKVVGSRVIDGSTIFVVINEKGEQPRPPAPSFQQIIYGIPKEFYNTNQLWYKPRHLRADAPYGRSPIEDALPAVKLLAQLWDYEYEKYQIGNIPELVFTCPENWKDNADQILEFEEAFNARMSGSNKERVRARFMPAGMTVLNTKELTFNKESYDSATNSVRMAYGILQSEVGDAPSGGLGGSGYAEAMQSAFYRMGLAPLIAYVESHFNDIIKFNLIKGRKFKLEFPPESLDPSKEEEKYATRFQLGIIMRDEARVGVNMKALGGEEGKFFNAPQAPGDEGDGGDPFGNGGGGKPGMINVGNKNAVQVRRPLGVLKKPVGVVKKPIGVYKVDGAITNVARVIGFTGDMNQFAMGMAEEQEHAESLNADETTLGLIVKDHLDEDPEYYTKLNSVMQKYDRAVLQKHCGVCAEDDIYYGSNLQIRTDVEMPAQGANESLIISMGDGDLSPRPAVWKPETGEDQKLREWVGGKLFCRGEAAYLLDRELAPDEDHYLVPVTFTAEIDGVIGSVQHYVYGREPREDVNAYKSQWVERAAVLDYIMGQVDRSRKNWLTHPDDDSRPVLIDSDLSFPIDPKQEIHSSFVDAMSDRMLTEKTCDMIYQVLGNRHIWDDLKEVLDNDTAVDNAYNRAKELYEAKKIPMGTPIKVIQSRPIKVVNGSTEPSTELSTEPSTSDEIHKMEIFETMYLSKGDTYLFKAEDVEILAEDTFAYMNPGVELEISTVVPPEYFEEAGKFLLKAEFTEEEHPRANDGKFAPKGGGGGGGAKAPAGEAKEKWVRPGTSILDAHPDLMAFRKKHYDGAIKEVSAFLKDKGVEIKAIADARVKASWENTPLKAFNRFLSEVGKLPNPADEGDFTRLKNKIRIADLRAIKGLKLDPKPVEVTPAPEPKPATPPEPPPAPAVAPEPEVVPPPAFTDDLPEVKEFRDKHYRKAIDEVGQIIEANINNPYKKADLIDAMGKAAKALETEPAMDVYKDFMNNVKPILKSGMTASGVLKVNAAATRYRIADHRFHQKLKPKPGPEPVAPKPATPGTTDLKAKAEAAKQQALSEAASEVYRDQAPENLKIFMDNINSHRGGAVFGDHELTAEIEKARANPDPKEGFAGLVNWAKRVGEAYESVHGLRRAGGDPMSTRIENAVAGAHTTYQKRVDDINSTDWTPKRKASEIERGELETMLSGSAEMRNHKRLAHHVATDGAPAGGVNETYLADVVGDGRAIIKPKTSAGYGGPENEVYAYDFAKGMGFDVVPVTQYNKHKGKKASVQSFSEDCVTGYTLKRGMVKAEDSVRESFSQMAVLDAVSINTDRHANNWLFDPKAQKVVAIDNGFAGLRPWAVGDTGGDPSKAGRKGLRFTEGNWGALDAASGGSLGSKIYINPDHIAKAEAFINSPEYKTTLEKHFDPDHAAKVLEASKAGLHELRLYRARYSV